MRIAEGVNKNNRGLSIIVIIAMLVSLIVCNSSYSYAAGFVPIGDENTAAPDVKAEAVLLYSVDLEKNIYSKKEDEKHAPYSITKLVTAVLVAEHMKMDRMITISEDAATDMIGGSTMFLEEGEVTTVEELMYGLLLVSGNDAAYALAENCSGTMDVFVEQMNAAVKEWGCTNTHFTNAAGYDDEEHYTNAKDLLIIIQHAIANETVHKIMSTRLHLMPATNKHKMRIMRNHTTLMREEGSGVIGGKTGYWEEDDCTVALEYNKNELNAILILLKDSRNGRKEDARKLLEYARQATPGFLVKFKGDKLGTVWVKNGAKTRIDAVLKEDVYAYPKSGNTDDVDTIFVNDNTIEAPIKKGDKLGTYEIYVDGEFKGSKDVVSTENVEKGWLPSAIYISNRTTVLIMIAIVLIFALIVCISLASKRRRKSRIEKMKARKNR